MSGNRSRQEVQVWACRCLAQLCQGGGKAQAQAARSRATFYIGTALGNFSLSENLLQGACSALIQICTKSFPNKELAVEGGAPKHLLLALETFEHREDLLIRILKALYYTVHECNLARWAIADTGRLGILVARRP